MADATLPTVAMDTEAGTQYNVLHGYTSELDSTLFMAILHLLQRTES